MTIQAAVFLVFRGESYIQVHDNLDLFMAHYKVLTDRGLEILTGEVKRLKELAHNGEMILGEVL